MLLKHLECGLDAFGSVLNFDIDSNLKTFRSKVLRNVFRNVSQIYVRNN